MKKIKANDSEKLAFLISLINQYEDNPITKNKFALIDFKNSIEDNSLSLEDCCPPESSKDYVDIKTESGSVTRLVLLAD